MTLDTSKYESFSRSKGFLAAKTQSILKTRLLELVAFHRIHESTLETFGSKNCTGMLRTTF